MTHNGIDIDQFILLTIYPSAIIFLIEFLGRRIKVIEKIKFIVQGMASAIFALIYYIFIPNGGAQGLAIVLALFSIVLFFMAKRKFTTAEENEMHKKVT